MKASLEHHFDNHKYCNPKWCQFCDNSVRKADDSKRRKLQSKNIPEYKTMYNAVKLIHSQNTMPDNLDMLRHMHDSQKTVELSFCKGCSKKSANNVIVWLSLSCDWYWFCWYIGVSWKTLSNAIFWCWIWTWSSNKILVNLSR